MRKLFRTVPFALITVVMAGGCVEATRLSDVEAIAKQALQQAEAAAERANNALSVASEASFAASKAQNTAESALSCCNENKDKIDRALERTMRK